MRPLPKTTRLFCLLLTAFFYPRWQLVAETPGVAGTQPVIGEWSSSAAQHVYGLPEAKPNEKGDLRITASGLCFAGKTSHATIRLDAIVAVGAGNERVELWGKKGRLMRMAIPDGGSLAAAAVMHHRVDMFTVEFSDGLGGYHAAVFYLPANEAQRAVETLAAAPVSHREHASNACEGQVRPGTVRVPLPDWGDAQVPAAYRALVYEHVIEQLGRAKGVEHVYRDGEQDAQHGCAASTVQISVTGFRAGNQVKRASMGPAGMFAGTTEMVFEVGITNAGGKPNAPQQIKATVRGESESIGVAGSVAKKVAKDFAMAQKAKATEGARSPQS